jgi:hypothetical protein
MPAQPLQRSNKTFVAEKFGYDCPTLAAKRAANSTAGGPGSGIQSILDQAGHTQSEDCLTLNIWTKPQSGEKKKAVLVWIYGGGFQSGATNNPTYNGQTFAEKQDVVLVSIKSVSLAYEMNGSVDPVLVIVSMYSDSHLRQVFLTSTWVS